LKGHPIQEGCPIGTSGKTGTRDKMDSGTVPVESPRDKGQGTREHPTYGTRPWTS